VRLPRAWYWNLLTRRSQDPDNITSSTVKEKIVFPPLQTKDTERQTSKEAPREMPKETPGELPREVPKETPRETPNGTYPTDRPEDHRRRALSVGSDTMDGSEPPDHAPLPPPSSRPMFGNPGYKSSNPSHQSRRINIGPKTSVGNGTSPTTFPMSSSIAGLEGSTVAGDRPGPPSSRNMFSRAAEPTARMVTIII